ncbi:MAG: hypothetical protein IJ530_01010 [Treponema sp.]|uniref:hypothetical protein n=1 Tax=Treponema sp. TaxID=166 RepID=UPI0025D05FE6|nr:hypothetical protein [Treponema sp.]MBQ8678324.1 hypothetical protein [Treponema sp.]
MKNFKSYQHRRILLKEGQVCNGDYIIEGEMTIRCKNGFLNDATDENGGLLPAIMTADASHIEHWKDGVLHCEKEPAVIDLIDNYEEWWLNGRQVPPQK